MNGFAALRGYALLGDLRAIALVATDGAIDWLALPTMDLPPVCAALLDPEHGGSITLAPTVSYEVSRRYLAGTMVLETTFTTSGGTAGPAGRSGHRCRATARTGGRRDH